MSNTTPSSLRPVKCPSCSTTLGLPASAPSTARVRCRSCGTVFSAGAAEVPAPPAAVAPPPVPEAPRAAPTGVVFLHRDEMPEELRRQVSAQPTRQIQIRGVVPPATREGADGQGSPADRSKLAERAFDLESGARRTGVGQFDIRSLLADEAAETGTDHVG